MIYKIKSKIKYIIALIDLFGYILFSPFYIYNQLLKKIKSPKKILIIKNDFIGDVIIATPFFENLRFNYPKSEIHIACRSSAKSVLSNNPNINKIIELNTPWISRKDSITFKEVVKFTKKNFRKYDLVFDLHTHPLSILMGKFIGKNVISYSYRGFGFLLTKSGKTDWKNKPMAEQNIDLLKPLRLKIYKKGTRIYLTKKEIQKAKTTINSFKLKKAKIIGIHPGTSDIIRQWPAEKFNGLIKQLEKQYNIILFETDLKNANLVCKGTKAINLAGKVNLREFFALINEIDLLIGLESMAIHVASAVNTTLIDIHSSTTNKNVMGPYTKNKIIIQNKVKCKHCNDYYCPNNNAIIDIQVKDVLKAIKQELK
jgi:ADP-heptose:LPS heptosyltransferase